MDDADTGLLVLLGNGMKRVIGLFAIVITICLNVGCNESARFAEIRLVSINEVAEEETLFRVPNEGEIYLTFSIEISNNTDDKLYSSPAPQGEKYLSYMLVDNMGAEYFPFGFKNQPDHSHNYAEAHETIRQDIYFEIPEGWESATFSVSQYIFRKDESKIIFTHETIKADFKQ
ncbi:MAG: hypothetical protein JW854_06130 [Actinobacteria bacterium]|nr:hypothetical protein [Actinomycetota bacterium]